MQSAHSTMAAAWAGKLDHKNPPSAPPAIPPIIITPFSRPIPVPAIDPRSDHPGPPIEPPPLPGLRI